VAGHRRPDGGHVSRPAPADLIHTGGPATSLSHPMVMVTIMTMDITIVALFGTRDHIDSAIMLTGTITPCIESASQSTVLHVRA
jgi:hypothetical protein